MFVKPPSFRGLITSALFFFLNHILIKYQFVLFQDFISHLLKKNKTSRLTAELVSLFADIFLVHFTCSVITFRVGTRYFFARFLLKQSESLIFSLLKSELLFSLF